jgi:hypothetical protein
MRKLRKIIREEIENVLSENVDLDQYPAFVQEAAMLMNMPVVGVEEVKRGEYRMEFRGTIRGGINIDAFGRRGIRIRQVGFENRVVSLTVSD